MKRAETCSCSLCNKLYISLPTYSCARLVFTLQSSLLFPYIAMTDGLLDAFAELSKAIVTFVTFSSVRMKIRFPMGGFSLNFISEYFSKICRKIHVSLTSDKHYRYFTRTPIWVLITSRWILPWMINTSHRCCTDNQNTHFIISNNFPSNRAVYEIMWKYMVQPDRSHITT